MDETSGPTTDSVKPVAPAAPLSLRERNKAEKLARIKQAAKSLFEKSGFEATTTKEIADAAGVATGTIFLYAKTKDEILYLIFDDEITRVMNESFATISDGISPVQCALTVFSDLFRYYGSCPELARSFIRRFVFIEADMSERYHSLNRMLFERLAHVVVVSQERGETRRDADPLDIVSSLYAIYGFCLILFLQTGTIDLEEGLQHLRRHLILMEDGLRA